VLLASVWRIAVVVMLTGLSGSAVVAAPTWGTQGHQVTAMIAQGLLTTSATSKVSSILSGQTLSDVANWADQVRSTPAYAWSAPLHFIDTPDWACTYVHSRDCGNNMCVAGAIANYTKRLVSSSLPATQINEALKFLTHFCGDIHQPLHVGFTTDRGGNTIQVTYESKKQVLHAVWDTALVVDRLKSFNGDQTQYANYLLKLLQGDWKTKAKDWATCASGEPQCADDWAVESIQIACTHAYVDQNGNVIKSGDSLTSGYFTFNSDIIDQQLAKGGVRLAKVLNDELTADDDMLMPNILVE